MNINPVLRDRVSEVTNISCVLLVIYQMALERCRSKAAFVTVELGVNGGNSTVALATAMSEGNGRLFSCDVVDCDCAAELVSAAGSEHVWEFTKCNSIEYANQFKPSSVDLVFLDTDHTYENTVRELAIWSEKMISGGRMLLHDTLSCGDRVGRAISEFLSANPDWRYYNIDCDCGLGVLDKP